MHRPGSIRKRLRRKKRVGEYREFGFPVAFRLEPHLVETEVDAFIDDLIDIMEDNDLGFGGGGKLEWQGYVTRSSRGSATDSDRETLHAFLQRDSRVQVAAVGPLNDAWYGNWDEDLALPAS
ncbi:MAG TPA: 50S ribosome-binding protein YggL [Longimicrobiales bacterium]|nr:50S ribosome-binding protein YggL [Longimicrobiales bacterium]